MNICVTMNFQDEKQARLSTGHLRLSDRLRSGCCSDRFVHFSGSLYSPKVLYPIFNETVSIIQFAFPLVRTNFRLICRHTRHYVCMGEVNLKRSRPQERVERPAVAYVSDSLRFGLTCSLNFYSPKLSEDIQSLVQAEVLFTGHK